MKQIIFILLFVVTLATEVFALSEREELSNQILAKVGNELIEKYSLSLNGFGGSIHDGIRSMSLMFSIQKPLSKSEARKLLIECMLHLLDRVNSDEEIRPYLEEYPFPYKGADITIFIKNFSGKALYYPEIHSVSAYDNGRIYFHTKDINERYGYKTEESETFEEALEIVQSEEKTE